MATDRSVGFGSKTTHKPLPLSANPKRRARELANWISTDEASDVFASVRHAIRVASFVAEDPLAWKWIALALHSALQGACVCHLTTTQTPIGAVTKRNAAEWLRYDEERRSNSDARRPQTYLMNLPSLLKAIRKPRSAGDGSNESGVLVSELELEWLCSFHETIRNQFTHFAPMGWSVEVSGIPELGKLIGRIIGDIVDMHWGFRHVRIQELRLFRCDIDKLARGDCFRNISS
ncbi:MAG TPA: hypothetical protein VGN68_00815 [Sphingopyxis sp.]|uniref:hypothetical protein n=1 Tax=Sphingopyxis sp. TaxID=1908224 RepID=UPI002E0D54A1|nr:hypothetical protein [Sphingopyxis sp.]